MKALLEKVERIGSLFEIYGELLTSRQRELTLYYYFDDLSLAEIATELGVSRQAVFFGLKRAEEALEGYEAKLNIYAGGLVRKSQWIKAKELLKKYRETGDMGCLHRLEELLDGLFE